MTLRCILVNKIRLGHVIRIEQRDLSEIDFAAASVLLVFLTPNFLAPLEERCGHLRPGARVVSYAFAVRFCCLLFWGTFDAGRAACSFCNADDSPPFKIQLPNWIPVEVRPSLPHMPNLKKSDIFLYVVPEGPEPG